MRRKYTVSQCALIWRDVASEPQYWRRAEMALKAVLCGRWDWSSVVAWDLLDSPTGEELFTCLEAQGVELLNGPRDKRCGPVFVICDALKWQPGERISFTMPAGSVSKKERKALSEFIIRAMSVELSKAVYRDLGSFVTPGIVSQTEQLRKMSRCLEGDMPPKFVDPSNNILRKLWDLHHPGV